MNRFPPSVVIALAACGGTPRPAAPVAVSCPADRAIVLGGQEDVAAVAGCTTAIGLSIRTGAPLDLAPLRSLQSISGDLLIGPTIGIEEAAFPELRSVGGAIEIESNSSLRGLFLPRLERVGRISIDNNVSLTTLSMPQLHDVVGSLVLTGNNDLELVDLSALVAVGKELVIADNGKLSLVEADRLSRAGDVRIENNRAFDEEAVAALRAKVLAP